MGGRGALLNLVGEAASLLCLTTCSALLIGLGAVGWGTSPHTAVPAFSLIPMMLGKEGRLFVLGYALAAIYEGKCISPWVPVSDPEAVTLGGLSIESQAW